MHEDYLSKETGKRKEGLRDLDWASVQNKIERRRQACTGERRRSSRRKQQTGGEDFRDQSGT